MRLSQAKVHFIGIGGIGMSGIAELLHTMGAKVSGSDVAVNQQVQHLRSHHIPIAIGHRAENLHNCEVVVYSSAIKPSNPEYRQAILDKIPLIPRAEALAELMRLKRGLSVAGTHGKTTTTSLVASIFLNAHLDPTIVVGGRLEVIQSTAQFGRGDWLIAESDESDGSFNRLSPEVIIITNVDNDHLDHYGTIENLHRAFQEFAARIPFYGLLIVCGDDPVTRKLFADFGKRIVFYGLDSSNTVILKRQGTGFEIFREGESLVRFALPLPGVHNALNATAAFIAANEAGISYESAALALKNFRGVGRRFQKRNEVGDILFYDDYAHHPTEIKAVLSGFHEMFPDKKVVVLFQPHRYSRTDLCWNQFKDCFENASSVFVLDIYAAGEEPIQGVTSKALVSENLHKNIFYLSSRKNLASLIAALSPLSILVTLGAGDVWKVGDDVARSFE